MAPVSIGADASGPGRPGIEGGIADVVLAHAFGRRYELPIPLLLFVLGGAVVVLASFLLVVPRTVAATDPSGPDRTHRRPLHPAAAVVSLVGLGLLVACGLVGSQEVAENLVPTVCWLVVWIAVPLSCGLLGDWTQAVNPFANLAKLADSPALRRRLLGSAEPVGWPAAVGWWPAVALFFLLACGELIYNGTATLPGVSAVGLLLYAVAAAFLGLLFGPAWLERGEVFTVLFDTWGRLGWFRFGAPGRRGFAGGLAVPFEPTLSRIVFVLLLLVSVNFDGLLATPAWSRAQLRLPHRIGPGTSALHQLTTLAFVALVLLTLAVFGAFAIAVGRAGAHRIGPRGALAGLLPSLLPIAFGYLLAHNVEYLVVNGQLLLPLIGNPVGKPGWPVHLPYPFNDDFEPHLHLLPSAFYWYLAVVAIVAVHVVAVVLAHRHLATATADERRARRSEYPWVVAMIAYTMLSLWLLAQPLVKESTPAAGRSATPPRPAVMAAGPQAHPLR